MGGEPLGTATIEKLPFDSLAQFSFVVIPMFVRMGVLASRAKITEDLYDACYRLLSHVRGSLLIVSVMASAGFAAISSSTIVVGLGYDPIWFGIILIKLVEISAITPPVGLNLFAVMAAVKGQIITRQLYAGVGPFLIIEFVILAILVIFPEISLWLPNTMFGN